MHAERDTVLANLSDYLSVPPTEVLYLENAHTAKLFPTAGRGYIPCFLSATAVTKFQQILPQRGRKIRKCGINLRFSTEIAVHFRNGTS